MDIVELQSVAMEDLAMLSKFLVKNSLLGGGGCSDLGLSRDISC